MTGDIDWAEYEVPHEGVTVSDDGYYTCAACGTTLEPGFAVDRERDPPRSIWKCDPCDDVYWVSLRGPRYV